MAGIEIKKRRVLDRDFIFDIFSNSGFPENADKYFITSNDKEEVLDVSEEDSEEEEIFS